MKSLKCRFGFHQWGLWKVVDYSHFWWAKPKVMERQCRDCGKFDLKDME